MTDNIDLKITVATTIEDFSVINLPMVVVKVKYPLTPFGKRMLVWCKKHLPCYRIIEETSGELLEERNFIKEFIRENDVSYTEDTITNAELAALFRSGSFSLR
jgi:hypothetical protein